MNEQAVVHIKKGEARSLKAGGMWIYDNEIERIEGEFENGDMVRVLDFDGYVLGTGFINTRSKLTVRMMSRRKDTVIDNAFIEMRVRNAWEYRKATVDTSSCRIIFGEADFLPGIVVDKFTDVLVVESLALGIDRLKPIILDILKKVLLEDGIRIRGIYERSDAKVRLQEGMERYKGFIGEPFDTRVEIEENGVRYYVDVKDGQKTGFFLDQKYNRLAIQKLCKGKRVLDCFTHTGSFALNAAVSGAKEVLGVDASELGIAQARENAELNGVSKTASFLCADVFELLPELEQKGEKFDVVILDPPAFTKSRNSIKNAVKGYREINMRGLKLVKDGGFLATCSCSHFMNPELFTKTIREAATSVHKRLRQVEYRTQAADHPILWSGDESSYYLKFYIFQVCDEK
ncbi:class I SAM-dependent rRNA methyltransferase [[Clostridium] symbiosum]|uniref:class I SAM-dependent rRNA methyltransferase n=1 Tax=Clostridium symbiosum TaxID=1512 RepID=UPI001D072CB2|nr:class I SAM-dependent rRNA methyltransferase [[Clostridium] symbiosum]MCB6611150.1 class I SAM-dependent rRNA methyltransferase [[Clostridium] symbiosum]MCB6930307.1 class I SAM-dependent rRNA methyltransferase [[Clostridium] symbiosum]